VRQMRNANAAHRFLAKLDRRITKQRQPSPDIRGRIRYDRRSRLRGCGTMPPRCGARCWGRGVGVRAGRRDCWRGEVMTRTLEWSQVKNPKAANWCQ
jgi:hypothetical protein